MSDKDWEFQIFWDKIMNEYSMDQSVYNKQLEEVTKVTPSILKDTSSLSKTNVDNYSTHWEEETGKEYAMASKNWRNVDPNIDDP